MAGMARNAWWSMVLVAALAGTAAAQTAGGVSGPWAMEQSGTTAGLRGIHAVNAEIAWASGTGGTILRTVDGGATWTRCAVPPDAAKLDFRGVWAWDAQTAIAMSSGPGDLSRLYKTTDGCKSWKLEFTNPDKDGFWDAMVAYVTEAGPHDICAAGSRMVAGAILGDPVVHRTNPQDTTNLPSFYLAGFEIGIGCLNESLSPSAASIFALPGEAAFAASNSVLEELGPGTYWIATRTRLIQYNVGVTVPHHYVVENFCDIGFRVGNPLASAGIFSLAIRPGSVEAPKAVKMGGFHWKTPRCQKADMVAVGGDYKAPDDRRNTAAFTGGTNKFQLSKTPPHGYRSSVAWDPAAEAWIASGTNGSDISYDDGKTWVPLDNGNWNALSLPWVVGPDGRIGKLESEKLRK
jgi:hypothetical protein